MSDILEMLKEEIALDSQCELDDPLLKNAAAEINRLRDENARLLESVRSYQKEIHGLFIKQFPNNELMSEYQKKMSSLKEQLNSSYADGVLYTKKIWKLSDDLAEKTAEIERLRRIIRDVVRSSWPPPPSWYAEAQAAAMLEDGEFVRSATAIPRDEDGAV